MIPMTGLFVVAVLGLSATTPGDEHEVNAPGEDSAGRGPLSLCAELSADEALDMRKWLGEGSLPGSILTSDAGATSSPATVGDGVAAPKWSGAGSFPGSFLISDSDLSLKFGGRIKLDAIQDFDAIGNTDAFKTSSIPVPEESSNGNTRLHGRDTRLHMEARSPSELGEIRGYVEVNFFGGGDSVVLRHAYAHTDNVLFGQTWTNFMMIDSRPDTLDFEGPDGSIFLRQAQMRWTQPVGSEGTWTIALEGPTSDVTAPTGSTAEQALPDLTTGYRHDHGRGHLFLGAALREIAYSGMQSESELGWGANLSGLIKTSGKDNLRFQAAYGHGIARYIEDLRGLGLDGAQDANGDLEALPAFGGFIAYQHFWNEHLRSSAVFSTTGVDNSAGQAASTLKQTAYAAANLIWAATERMDFGVEYLHGTRENSDGQDAAANRLQFSLTYSI